MAIATNGKYAYAKTCPDCNGKPFVTIPNSGEVYFGLFKTPNKIVGCARCKGVGKIAPKEVILHPDRLEPEVIF